MQTEFKESWNTPAAAASPCEGGLVSPSPHFSRKLKQDLAGLATLLANVTEAYTASIFLTVPTSGLLEIAGAHTLSRDFVPEAVISPGAGLIGWVAHNRVRISVCPFEHDATTLLCYRVDQALKSFIAVPIVNEKKELLGVISCDSKKSYAFSKLAEKLISDCARQAARLVELHNNLRESEHQSDSRREELQSILDRLRTFEDEKDLLTSASQLPDSIISRDALVVLSLSESGVGEGVFYSNASEAKAGSRLLDLVCRHKRIICRERSVQAAADDSQKRSFLSVPFHIFGKEGGSLNLLSHPYEAFRADEIADIEKIAGVLGRELERLRLKVSAQAITDRAAISSWYHFALQAKLRINEAKNQKRSLTLLRLSLSNLAAIERLHGIDASVSAVQNTLRLAEQIKGDESLVCLLHGSHLLVLTPTENAERFLQRLSNLLRHPPRSGRGEDSGSGAENTGELIVSGLAVARARFPQESSTIHELAALTLQSLEQAVKEKPMEAAVNAWDW